MKYTLNNLILLEIAKYYIQRNLLNQYLLRKMWSENRATLSYLGLSPTTNETDCPVFDKENLLKNIHSLAEKYGWEFSAASGTFWFTKRNGKKEYTIRCNEYNWHKGGELTK